MYSLADFPQFDPIPAPTVPAHGPVIWLALALVATAVVRAALTAFVALALAV